MAREVKLVVDETVVWSLHCRRPATLDMRERDAKRADMKKHLVVIFREVSTGLGLMRAEHRFSGGADPAASRSCEVQPRRGRCCIKKLWNSVLLVTPIGQDHLVNGHERTIVNYTIDNTSTRA